MGAAAEKIESGFGRGIPSPDDDYFLIPVWVRLSEIVRDVREIFSGDRKIIRLVVKAGGDDDFFRAVLLGLAEAVGGVDDEIVIVAGDAIYFFVLVDVEFEMLDGAAVIFQGFGAGRVCRRRWSWAARRFPCALAW